MISFERVTKRYPDGTTAVQDLDLEVAAGEIAVLVGPSGCGKTTTLRMVNRMVEASSGRVVVDGRETTAVDPPALRRGIGYVIQQTGLFPHRTVAQNIATVPALLGWDRRRARSRADELMTTVGLPAEVAGRFPHQLSGGQQQRVGVARALAADPPIMLMDEPFGAVDPLVRASLQDELLRLQRQLHKTIVFVTHDIDEAIKMGDRIAVLAQGGRLAQYDRPAELLARPADDFVAGFLGPERGLKQLALVPVSAVAAAPGPVVKAGAGAAEARQVAAAEGTDWVVVVGDGGLLLGWAEVAELDGATPVGEVAGGAGLRPFALQVKATDTLRAALNAMISSRTLVAVRVDDEGRYQGIISEAQLSRQLAGDDDGARPGAGALPAAVP